MPERFSPAQPNYLRFVSTPTIDIEPRKRSQNTPSGLWSQCPESLWRSDFADNIQRFRDFVKRFRPKEKQVRKANNAVQGNERAREKKMAPASIPPLAKASALVTKSRGRVVLNPKP